MSTIARTILAAVLPTLIAVIVDNLDIVRTFLQEQAKQTDNQLDDIMVDIVMDWLEAYLGAL